MRIDSTVAKLKIFKVCVPNQHPWGLILVVFFDPFFLKYSPILVKFLTRCNIIADKNRVSTILEKFKFLRKNFDSECRLFVHFWNEFTPRKQKLFQKCKTLA